MYIKTNELCCNFESQIIIENYANETVGIQAFNSG